MRIASNARGAYAVARPTDQPQPPPGWAAEPDLVCITDGGGAAAAWVAPRHGANCVGFAVRRAAGWVQVFHVEEPVALRARPTRSGCGVLFPFPGHVRGARYCWDGVEYTLPPPSNGSATYAHGFARSQPWRVVEVEPAGMQVALATGALPRAVTTSYPFAVRLLLSVSIAGGSLTLTLEATNDGDRAAPVGLGLHPYIAPELFGPDRTAITVDLPGQTEHTLLESIPTGERRMSATSRLRPPPLGQALLIARTDLGARPVATLSGLPGGARATVATTGCRDLLFYAPDDRPSIALEPHSCAPGAASQRPGHPDGLVGLAPGASVRLTMTLRVEDM